MSSTPTRRKWELGIAGSLILATAIICGWLVGFFGNVPPFPKEFHDQEVRRRAKEANDFQNKAIPRARVSYPVQNWNPRSLDKIKFVMNWQPGKISLRIAGDIDRLAKDTGVESHRVGQTTVLLINDTDDTLGIPYRAGINLMLEVKLANKWQRAQYHFNEWLSCGYSHGTCFLPPHSYVPLQGYQPTTGRVATTRFAIHNGAEDILMSEEFEGAYSPDDVAMSSYDTMSFRTAGLDKLRAFLLREDVPPLLPNNEEIALLRHSAWDAILSGRHEKSAALAAAKEVLAFDPTLERHTVDIGKSIDSRLSALEHETRGRVMIHGFTVSERLVQNASPQSHQNNGTP